MDSPKQKQSNTVVTGAKDRPWEVRAWNGMGVTGWLSALVRHRFAVSPSRVPMVLIQTVVSFVNSGGGLLQTALYGRRIARTQIEENPIFVLGHWRSGTTLLHELLVCDPRHTCPDTLTSFAPSHFLVSSWFLKRFLKFLKPSHRPMDNISIDWDSPQEDEWALCGLGLPSPYFKILFPNCPTKDGDYLDLRNLPPAARQRWKRVFLRFLKSVTVRSPKRIVLKTPTHTCRVRTLLEVFPNARFVHVVRDPYVVFPSTIHTWKRLYRYHGAQVPRYEGLEESVLETFTRMYEVFEEDRQLVDSSRFCEVHFEELVRDPIGQMRSVYERLGLEGFDQALPGLREYTAKMSEYKGNRYQISPQVRDEITSRWHAYIEKYGYGATGGDQ